MSKIYLYQMKCKRNVVNKLQSVSGSGNVTPILADDNDPTSAIILDVHFKFGGDLMKPEIIFYFDPDLSNKILRKCNYIKVNKLNRFYFVDNVEFIAGSQVKLTCTCDVLQTYSDKILSTAQMIRRNEFTYNGYYQDEKYPIEQDKMPVVLKITGSPFNHTNMTSGKRCVALTVSGGAV